MDMHTTASTIWITGTTSLGFHVMTWMGQMVAANGDLLVDNGINNTRAPGNMQVDRAFPAWYRDRQARRATNGDQVPST